MSFWDHLEELRWTIIRSLIALVVFAAVAFALMKSYIYPAIVEAPSTGDFILYRALCQLSSVFSFLPDFCDQDFNVHIFNIKMASQFFTHMKLSLWIALVLTFPYLIFEVWRFVRPALYENEKRKVQTVFLLGTGMFYVGCAVGYFLVFPLTLRFLTTWQLSPNITEQVSLEDYISVFLMLIFVMGILFEMPLVSWLLSQIGIINRSFFKTYRRYAVVILLVLSALITPSGDPFTLSVVFLPLYGLYELSAFFVKPAPPEEDDEDENDTALVKQ